MESTSISRALSSSWCCKTAARRTSFKSPKTNNLSEFETHCSTTADSSSASSSMVGSPFLMFQKCFEASTGDCFRSTRESADMSATNETRKKKKTKVEARLVNDEKPLLDLERAAAAAAAEQVPIVLVFKTKKPKEDGKFTWADKHQPKFLRDFICHREPAQLLLTLVC